MEKVEKAAEELAALPPPSTVSSPSKTPRSRASRGSIITAVCSYTHTRTCTHIHTQHARAHTPTHTHTHTIFSLFSPIFTDTTTSNS